MTWRAGAAAGPDGNWQQWQQQDGEEDYDGAADMDAEEVDMEQQQEAGGYEEQEYDGDGDAAAETYRGWSRRAV